MSKQKKSQTAGQVIRAGREAKGLTREEVAKSVKVSAGYFAALENGWAHLSAELANKLASKLKIVIYPYQIDLNNKNVRAKVKRAKLKKSSQPTLPGFTPNFNIKEIPVDPKLVAAAEKVDAQRKFSQPTLPGFLGLINNARIEEMVAELIFNSIKGEIQETVKKLKGG